MSALAFELPPAPGGARAARGAWPRPRRRPAARHRPSRADRRARPLRRPAASSSRPATCSSSTSPQRCPPRSPRGARTGSSSSCTSRRRRRADRGTVDRGASPGDTPFDGVEVGDRFELPAGASARSSRRTPACRLWLARLDLPQRSTRTSQLTASRSATATCPSLACGVPERLRARARKRRDGQRRSAVHRGADHAPRAAASSSPQSRFTPASRPRSATNGPTPSAIACRRRPRGWSTPFAGGVAALSPSGRRSCARSRPSLAQTEPPRARVDGARGDPDRGLLGDRRPAQRLSRVAVLAPRSAARSGGRGATPAELRAAIAARLPLARVRGQPPDSAQRLGGFGGMSLVAGVRWVFRGKDAGSIDSGCYRPRLRTQRRGVQRGPAAQPIFRQTLLGRRHQALARLGIEEVQA